MPRRQATQRQAGRAVVVVLDVEHLDPRPRHRGRVRTPAGERAKPRHGVQAAVRVGPNVELDLAHVRAVELPAKRRERILQRGLVDQPRVRTQRLLRRTRLHVVAVVRPDDLNLVETHGTRRRITCAGSNCNDHAAQHPRDRPAHERQRNAAGRPRSLRRLALKRDAAGSPPSLLGIPRPPRSAPRSGQFRYIAKRASRAQATDARSGRTARATAPPASCARPRIIATLLPPPPHAALERTEPWPLEAIEG